MKRLLTTLLTIFMIFSLLVLPAKADDENVIATITDSSGQSSQVIVGDGNSETNTLKSAIENAGDGSTVKIEKDLEITDSIQVNHAIIIDLNQKKITYSQSSIFEGVFVINSSSTIKNGKIDTLYQYSLSLNADCIIQNVTIVIHGNNGVLNTTGVDEKDINVSNSIFELASDNTSNSFISIGTSANFNSITLTNSKFDCKQTNEGFVRALDLSADQITVTNCEILKPTNVKNYFALKLKLTGADSKATLADNKLQGTKASLEIDNNSKGNIYLNKGNILDGPISLGSQNKAGEFRVDVNGSSFSKNCSFTKYEDTILNFNKAYFEDDSISSMLDSTHPIRANTDANKDTFPYIVELREDASGSVAYVPSLDTYFKDLNDAVNAAGNNVVNLTSDVSLEHMINGNIDGGNNTITLSNSVLSELKNITQVTNVTLKGTDGSISSAKISNGKIVKGTVSDNIYDISFDYIDNQSVMSNEIKEIVQANTVDARIEKIGYPHIIDAVTVATKNDSTALQKETIVLTRDVSTNISVYNEKSSFILDLNGYSLGTSAEYGIIIPKDNNTPIPNYADITVIDSSQEKTGMINGKEYGIVTNGELVGLNIMLDGVKIASSKGIGVYFPSDQSILTIKDTSIEGTTGLSAKGGTVNISGNSHISGIGNKLIPDNAVISGTNDTGDALYTEGNYDHTIVINIESGTFTSKNGYAIQKLFPTMADITINIRGGTFSSNPNQFVASGYKAYKTEQGYKVTLKVDSITLDKKSVILGKDATTSLKATLSPDNGLATVTWSSSDERVAKVDANGKVSAVCAGKATIIAKIDDELKAECEVIVYNVEEPVAPSLESTENVKEVTTGMNKEELQVLNDEMLSIVDDILTTGTSDQVSAKTVQRIIDAMTSGKTIKTEVIAIPVDEENIAQDDIDKIQSILSKDTKIAQLFDLRIVLKVDDQEIGTIDKLSKPLNFVVMIPESIKQAPKGYMRTFYAIRVHNRKAEKLMMEKNEDGQYVLSTNQFSTYAIVYEDQKEETPVISEIVTHKVTFVDHLGHVLKVETVKDGEDAIAPIVPQVNGYRFIKWDNDYKNVKGDLIVKAIYEKESTNNQKNAIKTGDTANIGLYAGISLLALISIVVTVLRKKQR